METGCLLHCLEVEETNVFEAVKQSVTTRQAALVYGISVGRNGMACCPFHDDRHPSMKVDRRFHCFACRYRIPSLIILLITLLCGGSWPLRSKLIEKSSASFKAASLLLSPKRREVKSITSPSS